MRILSTLFLMLACEYAAGQLSLGINSYVDLRQFGRSHSFLDASDLLNRTEGFSRVHLAFRLSEQHAVWSYTDLDIGLVPVAFGVGYKYSLSPNLYWTSMIHSNSSYLIYPKGRQPGHYRDFQIYRIGGGPEWVLKFAIFEFSLQSTIHWGRSESIRIRYVDRDFSSNLRTLDALDIRFENVRSVRINPKIRIKLFGRKSKLLLYYQFVLRVDWFSFNNDYEHYEWTVESPIEQRSYEHPQYIIHQQHHVGFTVDINWQ